MNRFRVVTSKKRQPSNIPATEGWWICWTGVTGDGLYQNVCALNPLRNAGETADLIARLLNWYHQDPTLAEGIMKGEVRDV